MPEIAIFCPATQTHPTLTLSIQCKPEYCNQQATCKKREYLKCLLKALKITGGKSI